MVNFGPPSSIPPKFEGRLFYEHNPQVTLMRTTPKESAELGRILAEKVNLSTGPVSVLLPTEAISLVSAAGQPFHEPSADQALFSKIKEELRDGVPCIEVAASINDIAYSKAAAQTLLDLMS